MNRLRRNRANLIFVGVCFGGAAWVFVQQGLGIDVTPW